MGKDKQPKHRQLARDLRRRAAVRQLYDRLLIVCEGGKTEPTYFGEIRKDLRLATAHVHVQSGQFGTDPLSVVNYAAHLFSRGDPHNGLEPKAFDHVYAVFDRDSHTTYHAALARIQELNNSLTNVEKRRVPFEAIPSVPCFEVWLLLHFEEVHAPVQRQEAYQRLRTYLPVYAKGQSGHWDATKDRLAQATHRAEARCLATTAQDGVATYTDLHKLVARLVQLRQ